MKVKLFVIIETGPEWSVAEYVRNEVENMIENNSDWIASVEIEEIEQ